MTRVDTLPSFRDRTRIGEGGIADVFRATWEGRVVAIKVLREQDREALRKRFLREGRLLQRLPHPGLPQCHAVVDEGQPVLVLELLEGEALDSRIARGPLPPAEVQHIARSLLEVLAHLHEHGVVHRDVKASNVWLGPNGRVVLMDLGLAAEAADPLVSSLGEVVGTHAYMAPEQIAGAESDQRCDLYSLGVTLYEALAGTRPYQARGLLGYLQAHRSGLAVPLRKRVGGLPEPLGGLVEQLMRGDPAERPASARVALALLTGAPHPSGGLRAPPMVGREGARGALQALLDEGGALWVGGEIGSGASAAVALAVRLARGDGVDYAVVRVRPRMTVGDVATHLAGALGPLCQPGDRSPAAVIEAIAGLVADTGRFLVVAEDLDLASAPLLAWFAGLARQPGIGLLATGANPPEIPDRRDHRLRPLTLSECRQLVGEMLGGRAPPGLDVALHRSCGGQPGLVVATLREQVADGVVSRTEDGDGWHWDPNRRLRASGSLTAQAGRLLHRISPPVRQVLVALGVAGSPLPLDVALDAAGVDASGVELGPALRAGLVRIERIGGLEWISARRVLVDPSLVASLSDAERIEVHARLAAAIDRLGSGEWAERTAPLHRALASGERSGVELVRLAEALAATCQPGEALLALDARSSAEADAARIGRRALARTDALVGLGRLGEARDALRAARAFLAEGGGGPVPSAPVEVEFLLATGQPLDAAQAERLESGGEARGRRLLHTWHLRQGEPAAAAALMELTEDRSVPLRDRFAATEALAGWWVDAGQGPAAVQGGHLLLQAAEGLDRPTVTASAWVLVARGYRAQGLLAAASDALQRAERVVAGRDLPWVLADIDLARMELELVGGPDPRLSERLRAVEPAGGPGAPWSLRARWNEAQSLHRMMSGDTQAALALHLKAADAADAAGDLAAHQWHQGMAALFVGDATALSDSIERLSTVDRPRLLALLLLAGARMGHDAELLEAAEAEARAAGDRVLLVDVLALSRGPGALTEAVALVEEILEGVYGEYRRRVLARPSVRWAIRRG